MFTALLWLAATPATKLESAPEDTPKTLAPITVEASKLPALTSDLVSRTTLIDAGRIERELAQTIDDLVRYEPGVDVVDQGSRFGFSGFSIRGIGGNRVLIEVDGVPTSGAFSIGSFSNASRDFVDVASLKQAEILRGPASALFGSDALGGVVSFVTKGPLDYLSGRDQHFDMSAGYNGVDDSVVLSATAALRSGDFSAMVRATARDGSARDVPLADPLATDSLNLLTKLAWGKPGAGAVELTLEDFDAETRAEVDSLERVQDFSEAFGFPFLLDTTRVEADDTRTRTRASIGQEWVAGRFGTDYLRWRAYRQDSETSQTTFEGRESFIAGEAGAVDRQRSFLFEQELLGLEINAASEFETGSLRHQLAYGFEYELTDTGQIRDGTETDLFTGVTSSQVGPDLFPLRDFPLSETTRTGLYVQDRIEIGAFTLVPGLRWDRFQIDPAADAIFLEDNPGIAVSPLDESEFSPKLGALWDLGEHWQLHAQYAEGFRAPPVNDVNVGFTNFQFGYTTIPNPDLEAEASQGVEFGVRYGSETAQWDLSLFQTRYEDFIEPFQVVDFDPVNQLLVFQSLNLDEVEIEGAEFQGRFAPVAFPDGLSLNFTAAYAEGKDQATGLPLNSIAPLNGVLGLAFDDPGGRWGGSFITRAAARQDDLNETAGPLLSPPGYVIYDLIAYWNPTDRTRLRAGLYNLTDHAYSAYLDVQGVPADVADPQRFQRPGRNFSFAFDWRF